MPHVKHDGINRWTLPVDTPVSEQIEVLGKGRQKAAMVNNLWYEPETGQELESTKRKDEKGVVLCQNKNYLFARMQKVLKAKLELAN